MKLVAFYEEDGATPLTAETLVKLFAGTTGTPQKYAVRNIGDEITEPDFLLAIEAVLGNDGVGMTRVKEDANTLTPPYDLTAVVGAAGAGGVWGATGIYGVVVTAINATGETIRSFQTTFDIDVTTKKVTYTWAQVIGATGYKIYRTATLGDYTGSKLRTTIGSGATVTFLDDGTATGAGAPPATNTTGGVAPDYGTPPAGLNTATADIPVGQVDGTLKVGEMTFFWVNRVVPSNATSPGNPRQVRIRFRRAA